MNGSQRQCLTPGHRAKYLVVADDSAECDRAVLYAARWARRVAADVIMVAIYEPAEFQHWLGVGDVMREEAEAAAYAMLDRLAGVARAVTGAEPERVVRTGVKIEEVLALIEEDADIAALVLAASTLGDGPGPLVTHLAGRAGALFPVPVTIVPGSLSDAEIAALV